MSWLTEPDEEWDPVEDEPKSRARLIALVLGGWLAVSLVVLIGLLLFSGNGSGKHKSTAASPPASTAGGTGTQPSSTPTDTVPAGWVRRGSDDQTNCAAHSYGQVQSFFAKTPCSSVHRLLATTTRGGRTVVIASNVVTFNTPAQAVKYLALVNSDGTGNISDLLREGAGYAGAPSKMPVAAFASRQSGGRVWVAEAGYVTGSSSSSDSALKAIAAQGIAAN